MEEEERGRGMEGEGEGERPLEGSQPRYTTAKLGGTLVKGGKEKERRPLEAFEGLARQPRHRQGR